MGYGVAAIASLTIAARRSGSRPAVKGHVVDEELDDRRLVPVLFELRADPHAELFRATLPDPRLDERIRIRGSLI